MRHFPFILIVFIPTGLFSQDSIPDFAELSRQVFKCICNKDYNCINKKMLSFKDFLQMNPTLQEINDKDSLILMDSGQLILNSIANENINSFYERANDLEINWHKVSFISMSDSTVDNFMLSEYNIAEAQCTIKFSEGENIYGIEYGLRFINKQWRIEEIHPYIVVYDKNGKVTGIMRKDGYDTYMDGYKHAPKKYVKK